LKKKYFFFITILILAAAFMLFALPKIEELLSLKAATLTASQPKSIEESPLPVPDDLPVWLTIYFTDPNPPDNLGHGVDQYVQQEIDAATRTIDVTSFDMNLPSLVNALAEASQRGVKVRVVYDGANGSLNLDNAATGYKPLDVIGKLRDAGVGLVDGGRINGLMHDKMVIVDSKTLFIGSWNLSYNDTYRNNNNLLKISDSRLIANYQAKFNELFVEKHFGTRARVKIPYPSLVIDGIQVENYMAPEDRVMDKLIDYVRGAQKTVHYMIFTFTHSELSSAMIARAKAGVEVEGVIEDRNAPMGALVDLYCAKLPVRLDGNKYTMHHKVIIIDGQTVITGSFNFTRAADTENDDNLLVLHSPAVAALYEQEYQKMYAQGSVPSSADINCTK
jgi:phosphatidylserine/phosphatidylglycerophosphate/cardiolipin synthase-like enzyme